MNALAPAPKGWEVKAHADVECHNHRCFWAVLLWNGVRVDNFKTGTAARTYMKLNPNGPKEVAA